MPAGATSGTGSESGRSSGWALSDVNREDPVKIASAADIQKLALAHVVESLCGKYNGELTMFVT